MIEPQKDDSLPHQVLEILLEDSSAVDKVLELLFNQVMLLQREQHLNAKQYERSEDRTGYANGFKSKKLKTRTGTLDLQVPQTRDGFYPSCIEKGLRSERALKVSLAQMYLQGVSTRKVAKITEELCGFEVSKSQVSQVSKELDEEFEKWRQRPLKTYLYLWLDARYEKVRHDGHVIDCAVLIAKGVDDNGHRDILGVSVSLSEAEEHWGRFLQSLIDRGLRDVKLIISDSHSGLRAARRKIFPGIPWQRCQFHLQQNAGAYVTRKKQRAILGSEIRQIFNAATLQDAEKFLKELVNKYAKSNPKLSKWLEENIPEGLTVFNEKIPIEHQRRLRTSNPLERVNKEIKRRTRVACIFPNEAACLRLVTAVLIEISEDWLERRAYLSMKK